MRLAAAIRPGDVLLVEGDTRISTAIKYLTQSTWSHAALYVGNVHNEPGEDPPVLIEADIVEGVRIVPPIGEWVLRSACAQARAWQDAGLPALTVAVNLSGRQFHSRNLPDTVERILAETGLPPENLELEVTESVTMRDVELTIAAFNKFKQIGVRLSIDDFGTGYSSLAYLKRFPIDKLKVDQSFVRNLTTDANDAAIARTVITLGHSLGLKVIAEGVETREQMDFLAAADCDGIQGDLISRPVPAEDFPGVVATNDRSRPAGLPRLGAINV